MAWRPPGHVYFGNKVYYARIKKNDRWTIIRAQTHPLPHIEKIGNYLL